MARAFDELQPLNGPWPPSLNAPMRSVNAAPVDTKGPMDAGVIADDAGNNPVQGNFRPGRLNPVDPSVDTFRQRFAPFSSDPVGDFIDQQPPPGRPVMPGTRERFLDPTKVIAGAIPQPDTTPTDFPLPRGFSLPQQAPQDFPLPQGFTPVEGEQPNKLQRFLKNVTPEGPISGIIGLIRTAGEAAQGQRPDLVTNPENAIPEAVQGGFARMGTAPTAKVFANYRNPGAVAEGMTRPVVPTAPPPGQLRLESLPPQPVPSKLPAAQLDAKRMAQGLRDTGQMPPAPTGAPIEMPGAVTPPPPPSPLLPPQTVREFKAVQKGVELKSKLNPESPENVSARDQALAAAIKPHLNSLDASARRNPAAIAALEAAIPSMKEALSTPGKAASVANWVRVYERASRASFNPQAKASLELATKNLNNNLGLDLNLSDFLKGP